MCRLYLLLGAFPYIYSIRTFQLLYFVLSHYTFAYYNNWAYFAYPRWDLSIDIMDMSGSTIIYALDSWAHGGVCVHHLQMQFQVTTHSFYFSILTFIFILGIYLIYLIICSISIISMFLLSICYICLYLYLAMYHNCIICE